MMYYSRIAVDKNPKTGGQTFILRQVPVTYHNPAGRVCGPSRHQAGLHVTLRQGLCQGADGNA